MNIHKTLDLKLLIIHSETHTHIHTSKKQKKMNILKKVIICHSFQKVKPIYYIDSLHIEWNISMIEMFDDYSLQIMKTQNSVSQKIRILHKINKKKDILNRNVMFLKSMFTSMHSILGWAPFAWITCCSGVMKPRFSMGFRSSALLGLVSLI